MQPSTIKPSVFLRGLITAMLFVMLLPSSGSATHFRYGLLTWRPRPDIAPRTIAFTVTVALRRDAYSGSHPDGFPDVGDSVEETIGETRFFFGDGSGPTPVLHVRVTAIDIRQNFIFGVLHTDPGLSTIRHQYPTQGNFDAQTSSCCRLASCDRAGSGTVPGNRHINNPTLPYKLETVVNVGGIDGTRNTPPTSTLVPIIGCRRDDLCSFQIPAQDADGDPIRFRLSNRFEASVDGSFLQPGDPMSGAPNRVSVSPSGLFTWDTKGARTSFEPTCPRTVYSTQVMMEDLDASGNPKSKVPIDFFLLLAGSGDPPIFLPPTPCDQTLFGITSEEITFTVVSQDPDPEDIVTLNAVGLPPGATMTPQLPINSLPGQPVSSVFRWRPVNSQVGRFVLNFVAVVRTSQTLCPLTLEISGCSESAAGDPQIVNFDRDASNADIPQGTDLSGTVLQDKGVHLAGVSGVNGAMGVYTNRTGPFGSDTDDLVPSTPPNYITTLANPGNQGGSDYGSIIADFVDPVVHLPRPVVLAELFFLDVEDSVARLTGYDGPGATGNVLDTTTTTNNPSASQFLLGVGSRLSRLRILSLRADFGSSRDSAAIDQLCFQFTPPEVTITDDLDPEEVLEVRPGETFPVTIEVSNTTPNRFRGTLAIYAILNPDDPARRQVRQLSTRNFSLPGNTTVSRTAQYSIPNAFGGAHVGERIQLAHYICSREMVVESDVKEMLLLVE